jgi:hypothetical protein
MNLLYRKRKFTKKCCLIIFSLTVLAAVLLLGCRQQEDIDNAKYEITKTGRSSWDVAIGRKGKVKVNCFLFPRSAGLEKEYQYRIAIEDEMIAVTEKQKEKDPTPELKKSHEEELQLRKEGRWPGRLVESWPNCELVIVYPVITEKVNKKTIVCRPDSKPLDIVLNMQSKQGLTPHGFLRIARGIVQQLEKTNVDWNELPVSEVPLCDDEGKSMPAERMPKEYIDFFKDAIFPAQH